MKKAKINCMADVHAVDVEWLWKPYLPRGKVTIIRGMPGDGKSMFVVALIAALSTGRPLFNEENWREPIAFCPELLRLNGTIRVYARTNPFNRFSK